MFEPDANDSRFDRVQLLADAPKLGLEHRGQRISHASRRPWA